jgi:hypothetical protein
LEAANAKDDETHNTARAVKDATILRKQFLTSINLYPPGTILIIQAITNHRNDLNGSN